MSRPGMRLTSEAQADRDSFESDGYPNCSCHLSPPCGSCLHPGNPANQNDDDSCWEKQPVSAIFFDTETTDRKEGEIIEAAWLRMKPAEDLFGTNADAIPPRPFIVETLHMARYKPTKSITHGAMAVHHILPSELEQCPPPSEFALPADCEYIIGHSIDFDWEAAGRPNVKRIDTHAMAQWVYPNATGYSLVALTYQNLGATESTRAKVRGAHSADHDCYLASLLLEDILNQRPEITTWSALYAFSEECRIPRTCPMKKYEGVLLEDLDDGFIQWCLDQSWLDPYYRKGLMRVIDKRYPPRPEHQLGIRGYARDGSPV